MIKKNASERRFNTAAARIMVSSKLPSDFFLPSREKETRDSSLWAHRHDDVEKTPNDLPLRKDPLLFTFHRSSSEDKLKSRLFLWPHDAPSRTDAPRKSQTKLPPVSLGLALDSHPHPHPRDRPKPGKENVCRSWIKDLG